MNEIEKQKSISAANSPMMKCPRNNIQLSGRFVLPSPVVLHLIRRCAVSVFPGLSIVDGRAADPVLDLLLGRTWLC